MSPQEEIRFFDRELSWIEFNKRVLAQAEDAELPLLERLKFVGIVSSNFDEFFMVRIAGLLYSPEREYLVRKRANEVIRKQEDLFLKELVPALEKAGLRRVLPQALDGIQLNYVRNLFQKELAPVLTPIAIRSDNSVLSLVNLRLYRIFELIDPKNTQIKHHAVVEIPKNFPRLISLPSDEGHPFMLVEDLISLFGSTLFTGFDIAEQGLMRLTRGQDFLLNEDKDQDFADTVMEALKHQKQSQIIRLEISAPASMIDIFKQKLQVPDQAIFETHSWMDLKSISDLSNRSGFDELKNPSWPPQTSPDFQNQEDLWSVIRQKDVLLVYPYDSFDAVVRFIATAAEDSDVLAIKQTLYRTAPNSAVISALERAAENGKQVTVLVELKARFDEEKNVQWARRLEQAGATVLYGVAGYKTHAKACLVVRREADGIRRYVHLSTGNYNEITARIYSDIGFFTSNEEIAKEVSSFFNLITGFSQPIGLSKIEIAPYTLRPKLRRLILRESMRSRKDEPGLIIAKMNSLVDPDIIEALYHASQAGVKIQLNVRGICCLRPGIKGLSENIEVVSVVDRFLEHSRIFYFLNAGEEEVYLSSADWMPRNLDKRLEIMFPIEDSKLKSRCLETLKLYFNDNTHSWKLQSDGSYQRKEAKDEKKFRVQEYLYRDAVSANATAKKTTSRELKPQRPKKEIDIRSSQET